MKSLGLNEARVAVVAQCGQSTVAHPVYGLHQFELIGVVGSRNREVGSTRGHGVPVGNRNQRDIVTLAREPVGDHLGPDLVSLEIDQRSQWRLVVSRCFHILGKGVG